MVRRRPNPEQAQRPGDATPLKLWGDAGQRKLGASGSRDVRRPSSDIVTTHAGLRLYPVFARYAWPAELDAMALVTGLALADRYAAYHRRPFKASSARQRLRLPPLDDLTTMPSGPDNDPAFQPIDRLRDLDVARWGTEGGKYSDDGRYRWSFRRRFGPGGSVCWVGLNPGTGDSDGKPRPTLRKTVAWSQRWGGGEIVIVNLFAFRTTDPKALKAAARAGIDVVGEQNDEAIRAATSAAMRTVAAWGAHGRLLHRGVAVARLLDAPVCLGLTRRGEPRHPLYVPAATPLTPYTGT